MITTIKDLKNRIFAESNTIKSIILSSNNYLREPSIDDIILHDYQIANSVTINSIILNFLVNIRQTFDLADTNNITSDSYFRIVSSLGGDELPEKVKMVLLLDSDNNYGGVFERKLQFEANELNCKDGTIKFVSLDKVWYGIVLNQFVHNSENDNINIETNYGSEEYQYEAGDDHSLESVISYDQLEIVDGMNEGFFGGNQFNSNRAWEGDYVSYDKSYDSVNDYIKNLSLSRKEHIGINSIVENLFYRNNFLGDTTIQELIQQGKFNSHVLCVLPLCKYLICHSRGLIGLAPQRWEDGDDSGTGFRIYDLGDMISTIVSDSVNDDYEFISCSFGTIEDETTLFVIFKDRDSVDPKYHYLYLNDNSYDKSYGFTQMESLVTDSTVLNPDSVFTTVDSIKQLDTINIAMTNYGFWDIEPNNTREIVQSYRGEKDVEEITNRNDRTDKLLHPTFLLNKTDLAVQYDKSWELVTPKNVYRWVDANRRPVKIGNSQSEILYPKQISIQSHGDNEFKNLDFLGGTEEFGVYNVNGDVPAHILVRLEQSEFNNLLFSNSVLSSIFIKWFYYDVVVRPEQSEYYLQQNHPTYSSFVNSLAKTYTYSDLDYLVTDTSLVFPGKQYMWQLVSYPQANQPKLQTFTKSLYQFVNRTNVQLDEIISQEQVLSLIRTKFSKEYSSTYLSEKVKSITDSLVNKFSILGYFRTYIESHLMNDLAYAKGTATYQLDSNSIKNVISNILSDIRRRLITVAVLGGYDSTKSDTNNEKYPGISSYLYQDKIDLRKSDIQTIMSTSGTLAAALEAVQSTKFYKDCGTYLLLSANKDSQDLFNINENGLFLTQSGYVTRRNGTDIVLNIDWDQIKDWLFNPANVTDEKLLKNFIKTQIYRPLFFDPTNYKTFSNDKYRNVYRCTTDRFYENHNHEQLPLKLNADYSVKQNESGLGDSKYKNIKFVIGSNELSYEIHSNDINIIDEKFVYNGVEYYCTRADAENPNKITTIYLNEFQNHPHSVTSMIKLPNDGIVTLGGINYKIDLKTGRVLKSQYSSIFGQDKEFILEIDNDCFTMNNVRYVITRDGTNTYLYSTTEETCQLVKLIVQYDSNGNGIAKYDGLTKLQNPQLTFKMSITNPNKLNIVQFHITTVINKIQSEWCAFDDVYVVLTQESNHTYEWYIANELIKLIDTYKELQPIIHKMGNGLLYSGWLDMKQCQVDIKNELQNGVATTFCTISRQIDGEMQTKQVGVLTSSKLQPVQGKVVSGSIANGVFSSDKQTHKVIFKDSGAERNNLNAIWIANDVWERNYQVQTVGTCTINSDTNTIQVEFKPGISDLPPTIRLEQDDIDDQQYFVYFDQDADSQYKIKKLGDTLGVIVPSEIAKSYRYSINTYEKIVTRLVFNPMQAETIDFSTQYTPTRLKDSLQTILKTYITYSAVQKIVDNKTSSKTTMKIEPKVKLGLYLDLLPMDFNQGVYQTVSGVSQDSYEFNKYSQIYENNSIELNESNIIQGNMYQYLNGLINGLFKGKESITLLDKPSISVKRVNNVDQFSYEVYFDLNLRVNKSLMKNNDYNGKYIIGNAIVKDLRGIVILTPSFNETSEMTYTVQYRIPKTTNNKVEYTQVIYNYDNKSKILPIPSIEVTCSVIQNDIVQPSSLSAKSISQMTNEFIGDVLLDVFNEQRSMDILLGINNLTNQAFFPNQVVSVSSTKNEDNAQVWELSVDKRSEASKYSSIVQGKTIIQGIVYNLSLPSAQISNGAIVGGYKLTSIYDSNDTYDVVRLMTNTVMSGTNLYLWAALGDDVVSNKYLTDNFESYSESYDDDGKTIIGRYLILKSDDKKFNPSIVNSQKTVQFKYKTEVGIEQTVDEKYIEVKSVYDVNYVEELGPLLGTSEENDNIFEISIGANGIFDITKTQPKDMLKTSYNTSITIKPNGASSDANSWIVDSGRVDIQVAGIDGDNPTLSLIGSKECVLFNNGLPDATNPARQITHYSPVENNVDDQKTYFGSVTSSQNEQFISEEIEEFVGELKKTYSDESVFFKLLNGNDSWTPPTDDDEAYADYVSDALSTAIDNFSSAIDDIMQKNKNIYSYLQKLNDTELSSEEKSEYENNVVNEKNDLNTKYFGSSPSGINMNTIKHQLKLNETTTNRIGLVVLNNPQILKLTFTMFFNKSFTLLYKGTATGTWKTILTSGILLACTNGTLKAKTCFRISDANQNDVNALKYGVCTIPTNIQTAASYQDLYLSNVYLQFNDSYQIVSGGRFYPVNLEVIGPNESPTKDGEVYSRYYEKLSNTYVTHMNLTPNSSLIGKTNKMFWVEQSNTIKSINIKSQSDEWKKLITESVPQKMVDAIYKHIDIIFKLQDTYFTMILSRLQTFLQTIDSELKQDIGRPSLTGMCKFIYSVRFVFPEHDTTSASWNQANGLFGYNRSSEDYISSVESLNTHLFNEFLMDYAALTPIEFMSNTTYDYIVKPEFGDLSSVKKNILAKRNDYLEQLLTSVYEIYSGSGSNGQFIATIFGNTKYNGSNERIMEVKFIGAMPTSIVNNIVKLYIFDGICHVFSQNKDQEITWNKFNSTAFQMDQIVSNKCLNSEYVYNPILSQLKYKIDISSGLNNFFIFCNRDLVDEVNTYNLSYREISDAFAIRCFDESASRGARNLWYVSELNAYIYSSDATPIVDVAYEQYSETLYVMFNGDNHIYSYNGMLSNMDGENKIQILKESAKLKIETYHSAVTTKHNNNRILKIYLDYSPEYNEMTNTYSIGWDISIYGQFNQTKYDVEHFYGNPGQKIHHFKQRNIIIFGDSLFSDDQLKFQNISKNKEMFDILDVNEIDGCYYGLFLDEQRSLDFGRESYRIFKITTNGVVERLPYDILVPSMFKTSDSLYSLYVVVRQQDGTKVVDGEEVPNYTVNLQEISVPTSDLYTGRIIPVKNIIQKSLDLPEMDDFKINDVIATELSIQKKNSSLFVLTNYGFHRVKYRDDFNQLSIETRQDMLSRLTKSFNDTVIQKHITAKHDIEDRMYFQTIAKKVNQFDDSFEIFNFIPTEFRETQNIGVVPNSIVDDTDDSQDHRGDSIITSTDILQTDGIVAGKDSNPGFITAAVSNPATTYDDNSVFTKSQRNPSIEGTEFYDYIYDQDGNELMDLYAIPFIYRINSNNTYDLYINIPTTRTKYLNRVAGTLKDDLTTMVLPGDTRTRINFSDERLSNNMDESTTKLRIYIDRKFISIGNVELVEISGNSIPLQIYRDSVNNGLYDSIALESRWNGEVEEIVKPDKDINKVMLEFECYGTDSQSIHITGKTLINPYMDDRRYKFE